jgi:transposase
MPEFGKIIKGDFGEKIFNIQKNGVRVIKDIDVFVSLDIAEELCHKHYGKRLIITDQFSWTTKEILEAYWDQSKIENIFRIQKTGIIFLYNPSFIGQTPRSGYILFAA